jgi:hypothetical protein
MRIKGKTRKQKIEEAETVGTPTDWTKRLAAELNRIKVDAEGSFFSYTYVLAAE